ncbi:MULTISPECIES: SLC13 family permease [Sphingomonas]|jgi:di/tricarboxylate transporter|uniref:SLC13 family permease n=1 Tax=Sphingomonas TaxID=13687 RepID=UPI0006FA6032|nr:MULTISPECIES: SLC13 family permease [unclassified Sphingomonas]RYE68720.1 MAG: SLC13 family permease [Rhizobiaceae bacterium]KQM72968.1 permease [Sphingomonas sp. Leaf20]KQN06706.1 permease [Sphingomonas sp. Leaf28]KQS46056.1 permease [Sphingomonas sp. Leaf198]MBD8620657.1 anion permease [Sphingomonas sp. CFBP 13728]
MTTPQLMSIGLLIGMMGLFLWGRFRYDVTAIIALLAGLSLGLVKPKAAFTGFSDDIVIIVGSALVISSAMQRSGLIESALGILARRVTRVRSQLVVLTTAVGVSSGLVKNVGALAMLMPAAVQTAKKSDTSPSVFLMPMSFASLLGGLMTLVGTSPNIIVSRVREQMTGEPFGMFDYLPTGLGLLVVGLIFLRFGYRLLPRERRAAPTMGEALNITDYVTEATIQDGSPAVGETVESFIDRHDNEVTIANVVRDDVRTSITAEFLLAAGDTLILGGDPDTLERVIAGDHLALAGQHRDLPEGSEDDEVGVIEAVITTGSVLVRQSAGRLRLQQRYGVNLIAVSRAGKRLTKQLSETVLRAGDVIVLQGPLTLLPERMRDLGTLPLAERALRLGSSKRRFLPLIILAVAMTVTATGYVPVAVAFFAAAGLMMATGALPLRDAYDGVEWPILIMLGALIPVSETLRTTGASDVLATSLAHLAASLPPWGAVALILVAAMAVTPFLNNAATVLVMAPIAAVFAHDLGYRPEAFLIGTAIGAGCDFLTPIGHQCNTLVFGPGGYRFSDYARLGAPLSVLVVLVGTPLVMWTWPLH